MELQKDTVMKSLLVTGKSTLSLHAECGLRTACVLSQHCRWRQRGSVKVVLTPSPDTTGVQPGSRCTALLSITRRNLLPLLKEFYIVMWLLSYSDVWWLQRTAFCWHQRASIYTFSFSCSIVRSDALTFRGNRITPVASAWLWQIFSVKWNPYAGVTLNETLSLIAVLSSLFPCHCLHF